MLYVHISDRIIPEFPYEEIDNRFDSLPRDNQRSSLLIIVHFTLLINSKK